MSDNSSFTEKRREYRFPIDATVKISDRGFHCSIFGECQNLSASGLLVKSRTPISSQKPLKIRIYEAGAFFDGDAEVVHSQHQGDHYLTGFKANFRVSK